MAQAFWLDLQKEAQSFYVRDQMTGGAAIFLGGLKNGNGTILADTDFRAASTVNSMFSVDPNVALSLLTEASAIMRFSVGDHVVDVALPTCRPPRYTGTATRDPVPGTCGAIPICSYKASTSLQFISKPTSCLAGPPFFASRSNASRPTKFSFFKSTSFPSPISAGEYFCS